MPFYDFKCTKCKTIFDQIVSIKDIGNIEIACPKCDEHADRHYASPPAVKFIGEGWTPTYGTKS